MTKELFVPGRVCLFGEHTDWASMFRRIDSNVPPGQVLIAGTNQGLYARVSPLPGLLRFKATLPDGTVKSIELPMDAKALRAHAAEGGFFSYAAGVAAYMLQRHSVDGVDIDNWKTTLPVRKGLSSSAALCVLVARAFGVVYGLNLSVYDEMEAAYRGEIMTPSRCGRMDQGCAFGPGAVKMTFDGDQMEAQRVAIGKPVHLLIVDLKGQKDTVRILSDLTRCYPEAKNDVERGVHEYLGAISAGIVQEAERLLLAGDAEGLGRLMTRAQAEFDSHMQPACPSELTSPKLHALLADPEVKRLTFGGKGIGSQGDGCAQFVVRDEAAREALVRYVEGTLGLESHPLDLTPPKALRKAVIPAAGLGTRMFPATKAVKKELLPIVTPDGLCKPIIQAIMEEALAAGVEEIAIIVRPEDEHFFRDFFAPLPDAIYNRLPDFAKAQYRVVEDLARRVTFLHQTEALGFGHAVHCAKDWVGDEPFLLLLGDHLYASNTDKPCATQLCDAFLANGRKSAVGLYRERADHVKHYGTVCGDWLDADQRTLAVREFAEKPTAEYAREHLAMPGLPRDTFLCIFGQYILTPEIFAILGRHIAENLREHGEFQLTSALDELRRAEGVVGCLMDAEHLDTGLPGEYLSSLQRYARA